MNMANAVAPAVQPAERAWPVRLLRTATSFPVLLSGLLVLFVVRICRNAIVDPDLWWHLRNAQHLVSQLHFPSADTYSFTTAGSYWLNHEWLSECFYYVGFHFLGLSGVFLVSALSLSVLVVAIFWLSLMETGNPLTSLVLTLGGSMLMSVGFSPRTQHFGWLCFVALLAVLLRFRAGKKGSLWLLPPIFCVWINCHGSWVFGVACFVIFVMAGLVPRDVGRLSAHPCSRHELRHLLWAGASSAGALFVNPFGYRLVLFPIRVVLGTVAPGARIPIEEFASVDFHEPRGKLFAAALFLIFATVLLGRKRWRIDDTLLTAFAVYSGLTYVRLLMLTGIVLPLVLRDKLPPVGSYSPLRERRILNAAALAVVIAGVASSIPSARSLKQRIDREFPAGAVEYLRAHPQRGHMFNLYSWGGYLEWMLPGNPTFIDGRGDLVDAQGKPDDHLQDYGDIAMLHNSQELLDRYQVDYVVYSSPSPLAYYLSKAPQWRCAYQDKHAVVYERVQTR